MLNPVVAAFILAVLINRSDAQRDGLLTRRAEVNKPSLPPLMPKAWPPIDQLNMIPSALLSDPMVVEGMNIVTRTVPASLLAIPQSLQPVLTAAVTYTSDPTANCYWPANKCIRQNAGVGYDADVFTCPQQNTWGLSLDDGPSSSVVGGLHRNDTGEIREWLGRLNRKATFFASGTSASLNRDELKALYAAGHQIASHTWTHHALTTLNNTLVVAELLYSAAIIYDTIGVYPTYMRPPYGDVDDRVRAISNALGFYVALWDKDSQDAALSTTLNGADFVFNNVTAWVRQPGPGFVSLEHDLSEFTAGQAVRILQYVQSMGASFPYSIVPVATCNNHPFYHSASQSSMTTKTTTTTSVVTKTSTGIMSAAGSPTPLVVGNNETKSDAERGFAGRSLAIAVSFGFAWITII